MRTIVRIVCDKRQWSAISRELREAKVGTLWVIAGEDSVSKGHNDIFNGVQKDALADLIGNVFGR